MDLNEISVFVKVVQTGSFTQTARQLGMPNSTVSHKVRSLEKRLGVQLIQRTTRKLHVTPSGQAYFARCHQGLEEITGAEAELATSQSEAQGLLRITAPVELGSSVLPGLVSNFMRAHTKVKLELVLTDRRVDLLSEGVDLAIRAGVLQDSTLIARKLGEVYFAPFASPGYLKQAGPLAHPKDLRHHRCIQFTAAGKSQWTLLNAKTQAVVPMSEQLMINDLNMVKALAVAGDGVALLPTFHCYHEVKERALKRVLPEWRSNVNPVHFVHPAQRFTQPKLSAFMAFATDALKRSLRNSEL